MNMNSDEGDMITSKSACCSVVVEGSMEQDIPRIGSVAPPFTAVSTHGEINFPEDYIGSWVVFFSHPSDFTPVCTTEFIEFALMDETFDKLNCKLLGLSVDGLFSHIAWLRTIKERINYKGINNLCVPFPLIADLSMDIAKKYSMIHPQESATAAVRALYFIDPSGIIRAIIQYPLSLGRNFDEIKRVLIALQTSDAFNVATPANWTPGDNVVIPPPTTCHDAYVRVEESEKRDYTCYDWFLCTKKLSEEEIFDKLDSF